MLDYVGYDLEALRQHLIDMNEVTLKADAVAKPVDGGLAITVTGTGRTVDAIQRMALAHARFIEKTHLNGWSAKTVHCRTACCSRLRQATRRRRSTFAASALSEFWSAGTTTTYTTSR